MALTHNIVGGPCKLDLALALIDRKFDRPRPVTFVVEFTSKHPHPQFGACKRNIVVHINRLEIEDGSGESWNVRGQTDGNWATFEAYFRTDSRTGTVTKVTL